MRLPWYNIVGIKRDKRNRNKIKIKWKEAQIIDMSTLLYSYLKSEVQPEKCLLFNLLSIWLTSDLESSTWNLRCSLRIPGMFSLAPSHLPECIHASCENAESSSLLLPADTGVEWCLQNHNNNDKHKRFLYFC